MNRKQILILGIAAALVLILILVLVMIPQPSNPEAVPTEQETQDSPQTLPEETTIAPTSESETSSESETVPQATEPSASETTVPVQPETAPPQPTAQETLPAVPDPLPVETESPNLTFPYAIPDTPLVIEQINSYDGIYIEDGSDIEISGVCAIILKNTGSECVEYARIDMTGLKNNLLFVASGLEPGASVAVLEAEKAPAVAQDYVQVNAEVAYTPEFERSEDILQVQDTEDKQLEITNKSDRDIPCVRVFYKFYMEDKEMYVGGITYTAKITNLKAGDSVKVAPSHYAVGKSKVIMVKIYETDME